MTLPIIIIVLILGWIFLNNREGAVINSPSQTAPPSEPENNKQSPYASTDLSNIYQWSDEAATAQSLLRVPKELILAMIWQESSGNPDARGFLSGEIGLMQLTPGAIQATNYSEAEVRDHPQTNIMAGATYVRRLYQLMGQNWFDALRAYNAGYTGASSSDRRGRAYAEQVTAKWEIIKGSRA